MSRFYMSSENSRGNPVTAAGRAAGQYAWLRGWTHGVRVDAKVVDGADVFTLYATGGSGGDSYGTRIGTVTLVDGMPFFTPNREG